MNALPALQTLYYDGWVLRLAGNYSRRANSVSPLYPSQLDTLDKISYCEKVFRESGRRVVFKLTQAPQPENLDEVLAGLGYSQEGLTCVQICDLKSDQLAETISDFEFSASLTEEWLDHYARLNQVADSQAQTMRAVLSNLQPARCFAALRQDGEIVAVGLAVLERGYIGLFDIVTSEQYRRQGLGRQLVTQLLHWGKENGAERAYLQVVAENTPAIQLYAQLGFQTAYQYWYRTKA